jgi:hypothetical protein
MSDSTISSLDLTSAAKSARESSEDRSVPSRSTLSGFAKEALAMPGLALEGLEPLSRLRVRTLNSTYQLTLLDPWEAKVLVQGGSYFAQPTEAIVSGSTFGGSLLKTRWIGCGMRMEIKSADANVVTSPVRSVAVEEATHLPGPF